jgi:molybdopterin-containing oxidoreductase family iron-sulfur binding subunit
MCSVACKSNNNLPNGKWYNHVQTDGGEFSDTARGTYPNDLTMGWVPVACQHCSSPACMAVCPVEAIEKRVDGIVTQDNEKCIGCKLCVDACPYSVRVFIEEEPEYAVDFPLGDWDAPQHKANTVEKCTYCVNRVDRDAKPACMELCLGRARYWGDLDNPSSEISVYLENSKGNATRLMEDKGTEPNCYYIK